MIVEHANCQAGRAERMPLSSKRPWTRWMECRRNRTNRTLLQLPLDRRLYNCSEPFFPEASAAHEHLELPGRRSCPGRHCRVLEQDQGMAVALLQPVHSAR